MSATIPSQDDDQDNWEKTTNSEVNQDCPNGGAVRKHFLINGNEYRNHMVNQFVVESELWDICGVIISYELDPKGLVLGGILIAAGVRTELFSRHGFQIVQFPQSLHSP